MQQTQAHAMTACDRRNLRPGFQALGRDFCLLFRRPPPSALSARDDLDPAQLRPTNSALRTMLMTVLITIIIPSRTVLMIMLKLHPMAPLIADAGIISSSA